MGFCLDPKNEPKRAGWQLLTRCCGKNADQARACAACKGANYPPPMTDAEAEEWSTLSTQKKPSP